MQNHHSSFLILMLSALIDQLLTAAPAFPSSHLLPFVLLSAFISSHVLHLLWTLNVLLLLTLSLASLLCSSPTPSPFACYESASILLSFILISSHPLSLCSQCTQKERVHLYTDLVCEWVIFSQVRSCSCASRDKENVGVENKWSE